MWRRELRALALDVAIESHIPGLAPELEARFATYPDAARVEIAYELAPPALLLRDGSELYAGEVALDALSALELDLFARAAASAPGACVLHAAALERDGSGLLLAGASGQGKSTMTLALMGQGAGYLTDELAAVHPSGEVIGLRRPVGVAELIGQPPGSVHHARGLSDGGVPWSSALVHPAPSQLRSSAQVRAVIDLVHAPHRASSLLRLSAGEGLAALWEQALTRSDAALVCLEALVGRVPAYRLTTRSIGEALEALAPVW